jgi:hypothetical protein
VKKAIRFWGLVFLFLAGLTAAAYLYDQQMGNADGLIGPFAYLNIIKSIIGTLVVLFVLHIGLLNSQKIIQNISLSVATTLVMVVILEIAGHVILVVQGGSSFVFRRFYIPADFAKQKSMVAGDFLPIVGRSHLPDTAYGFRNCAGDSLWRRYNHAGAMDQPRSLTNSAPAQKRVVIVGDSFMEGYMVNEKDRSSALLAQTTGLEHINFGVNGSNVVHYFLMYKHVAKVYGADVVMVGFLPGNDFEILDERESYNRVDWPIYVPYWSGKYPDYQLRHSLADVTQSISHGGHTNATLLKVADSVYASLPMGQQLKADLLTHSSVFKVIGQAQAKRFKAGTFTKYHDFSEEEWDYVRYSLEQIVKEAAGKRVLILSIPILADLQALKSGKSNRIDPALQSLCKKAGAGFVPLAPAFLGYKGNPADLYVSCDGHWSVKGESLAAQTILNNPAYRMALALPTSLTQVR